MIKKILLLYFAFLFSPLMGFGQGPLNGFMQGKGKGAVVISETRESYKKAYIGALLVDDVPVFHSVLLNSITLFATYGITDDLDVVINLPYIQSKGSGNRDILEVLEFQNYRRGVQDLGLYFKYNVYETELNGSRINLISAIGIQHPMGAYRVDDGLQSILAIGNRATKISIRAIGNYLHQSGLFASVSIGYSENSGVVPSAFLSELKAGFASKEIFAEIYLDSQNSYDGTDILGLDFDGGFPATKVNYSRLGMSLFRPIGSGFGFSFGVRTLIEGRNIGKATGYSLGLGYSF